METNLLRPPRPRGIIHKGPVREVARIFRVVVSGRRDEVGQKLVAELREIGVQAEYWRADVRHDDDVRDLVNKTVTRFGRLDIAVNNAARRGRPVP